MNVRVVHRQLAVLLLAAWGGSYGCGGDSSASPPGAPDAAADVVTDAVQDSADDADAAPDAPDANGPDASHDGEASTLPPACPTTPQLLPEDAVARATAALSSVCMGGPDDGFFRTQNYLRGTWGGWGYVGGAAFVECLSEVTTGCDGVRACFGYAPKSGSDTCGTCDGETSVYCADGLNARWDCAKYGGVCQGGLCEYPDKPVCDQLTFQPSCDVEGHPVSCNSWVRTGPACPEYGLTCADVGLYASTCEGTGASCTGAGNDYFSISPFGTVCQGSDVIETCQGGKTASLRCACFGEGFSCQSTSGAAFCGTASECDAATFAKTCNGTSVTFCNAGKITSFDCVDLGFAACSADPRYACETTCSTAADCPSGFCYFGFCA